MQSKVNMIGSNCSVMLPHLTLSSGSVSKVNSTTFLADDTPVGNTKDMLQINHVC